MKLSILDQAPISAGESAADALKSSIELAKAADRLGYTRYWVAEHHDMSGLACPNPDVMLGIIGTETERIRIGSGAVLLPHYKPYRVAETYNLLATLFPERIDLGIGRAPGGSAEAAMALSGNFLQNMKEMPDTLDDLLRFLNNDFPTDHMFSKVDPSPVPPSPPTPWLLGTSEKSAVMAAEKGLPYAFGHFMSDADGQVAVKNYKEHFTEQYDGPKPHALIAVSVICAETSEEAEDLALSSLLWKIKQERADHYNGVPSIEEAASYPYTKKEWLSIEKMKQKMIIGNPAEVNKQLNKLCSHYQVDECMIVTTTHCNQARLKSYELLSKEIINNT